MHDDLLKILVCPETKSPLEQADADMIRSLNQRIAQQQLRNRKGAVVDYAFDGGLIRTSDRKVLYPVRQGIPVMLVEESIWLE
jgi:uncharacterized protein YbaR (Trm112 family)